MSWLEPARSEETAEDRVLRDDLRQLLGGPEPQKIAAPTPETKALAEDLLREALRRRHTPNVVPLKRKPTFALLAAALPLALLIGGLGIWGVQQKRKAESLAAAVAAKEAELAQRERYHEETLRREREAAVPEKGNPKATPAGTRQQRSPRELVVPAERPATVQPMDQQQVKNPR